MTETSQSMLMFPAYSIEYSQAYMDCAKMAIGVYEMEKSIWLCYACGACSVSLNARENCVWFGLLQIFHLQLINHSTSIG